MFKNCLLVLVLLPLFSLAQIDNFEQAINSTTSDSLKAYLHIQQYQKYIKTDTAKALQSLDNASSIAQLIDNPYLKGKIQLEKGVYFKSIFQLNDAIEAYEIGLKELEKTTHIRLLLEIKMNLIWAYYSKDQQPKSIVLGYEMLKAYEDLGDSLMIAKSLKTIGVSYDYMSEHKTAIKLYNQALVYYILLKDKDGEAGVRHNLAGIYHDDGDTEKAIGEYGRVIEIIRLLDDPYFLAMATNNYGLVFIQSDFDKAETLFLEAQKIALNNEDLYHIGFTNQNLTNLYYFKKEYTKAQQYGLKTLQIATKIDNAQLKLNSNSYLFDIYYAMGNYKKAIAHKQAADSIDDANYTKANAQIIQELQAKYDADKKDAENQLLKKDAQINEANLKKQNILIVFILISMAGILLTGGIYIRLSIIRKKLVNIVKERNKKVESQAEKLKDLDAAKSRFFGNISHDLRTPLTLIMGSLEKIQDNQSNYLTNESSKDLDMAVKNGKQLLFLTNEINDLNQLEEGKLKLNLKPIDVNAFVKHIVNMFSSATESKSISLSFESSIDHSEYIEADSNHFERIIYNLLSNALKFTDAGGTIKVHTNLSASNQVEVSVTDTGKGIPEKSIPYVFDRFYQSLLNEYNAREGFGIGLALVKELVALHQGEITVQSQLGQGSTFTVSCPSIENKVLNGEKLVSTLNYDQDWLVPNLKVKSNLKIDIPEEKPLHKEKVLIVEDHPEIREYINDIIGANYVTRLASDGKHALDILNNEIIDLIVTDLMMPWMDGFELIESIKGNERFQNIPIMVVSARSQSDDRQKILDMGVNDFLIKPFKSKELLARIDNLIHANEQVVNNLFITNEDKLQDLEVDLLKKVESLIINNISNSKLSVLHLADEMAASERQVYRMIKKLAGVTPYEYIKEVRWQYVEYLLKNNKVLSISDAAKHIGMSNVTDFKRQFKKRFDKEPSMYIAQ